MAQEMDTVTEYSFCEKGNTRLWQNYRTITLISHPSRVILQAILSMLGEAVKKNSNNSLNDWRKLLLVTAWKSAPTKATFS